MVGGDDTMTASCYLDHQDVVRAVRGSGGLAFFVFLVAWYGKSEANGPLFRFWDGRCK